MKNHFCSPKLKKEPHINLEYIEFNRKAEAFEKFLFKIQNLALKVCPTPVYPPVAPVDGTVPNDQDRFDGETREIQNRRNFFEKNRERHVIRLLKKAMPNFITLKLLNEPEDTTNQELCTKTGQKLILSELCPVDDWSRHEFIEMSFENSEKFLTFLTKMCGNQKSLENRSDTLPQILNSVQQNSSNSKYKDNQQQPWQRNFRSRSYQNRRKRGHPNFQGYQYNRNYQNNLSQGSNIYQNNENFGRYGINFIRGNYRRRKGFRNCKRVIFSTNYNTIFNISNFQKQRHQNNGTKMNTGNSRGHVKTAEFSQKVCYICDYPNYTSKTCGTTGKSTSGG